MVLDLFINIIFWFIYPLQESQKSCFSVVELFPVFLVWLFRTLPQKDIYYPYIHFRSPVISVKMFWMTVYPRYRPRNAATHAPGVTTPTPVVSKQKSLVLRLWNH